MTKILLTGINGHMGQAVKKAVDKTENARICAGVDINTAECDGIKVYSSFEGVAESGCKPDVIIDFSHYTVVDPLLEYAKENNVPAVICTTGLSKDQISKIEFYSKDIPIFFSANMSIGINLIIDLVCRAAKILEDNFDIEIIEKHHNQKLDAPSGTALAIADAISNSVSYNPEYTYDRHSVRKKRDKQEIGIHAVRGGTIVGEHSVIFAGTDEVIEVKHQATSKEVFAVGAVRAALYLANQKPGLYAMSDLISSQNNDM